MRNAAPKGGVVVQIGCGLVTQPLLVVCKSSLYRGQHGSGWPQSFHEAIGRGWSVVRENLGNMVVMGLILIIGGVVISFVIGIPLFLALAPFFASIFGTASTGSEEYLFGGLGITLLCFVLYLPVLLLLGGILRAYLESAWTLTFIRLTGAPATPPPEELPAAS